jgi:general secretion pathway protein K
MRRLPGRQRGVALLVALLVVALAVILVAALLDRGELALARTRNALRTQQADAYALGLETWAARVLVAAQADQPGRDTNASPWALPMPAQEVPGGVISATMRDLNGCFNLNNLSPRAGATRAQWSDMFRRLLLELELDPALREAVEAWLGEDAAGGEANHYLSLPVPYRPRGGVFAHESELRLVRGVDATVYARLAPHVCALPPGTRLNLNTADPVVLASLDGLGLPVTITRDLALKLWNRGQARYGSVAEFAQEAGVPAALLPDTMFGVRSDYFLARAQVVLDGLPLAFSSLLERGSGVRVLTRSRGSDAASEPKAGTPTP